MYPFKQGFRAGAKALFVRSEPEPDLQLRLRLLPKMINTKTFFLNFAHRSNLYFFQVGAEEPQEPEPPVFRDPGDGAVKM